jgi:hypothetical protein
MRIELYLDCGVKMCWQVFIQVSHIFFIIMLNIRISERKNFRYKLFAVILFYYMYEYINFFNATGETFFILQSKRATEAAKQKVKLLNIWWPLSLFLIFV